MLVLGCQSIRCRNPWFVTQQTINFFIRLESTIKKDGQVAFFAERLVSSSIDSWATWVTIFQFVTAIKTCADNQIITFRILCKICSASLMCITLDQGWGTCSRCENLVYMACIRIFITQIYVEHNIALKQNSMTSRYIGSKSREVYLAPWHGFVSLFSFGR